MARELSTYLLDASLVDYTIGVVGESLCDEGNAVKKKRATLALSFFEGILDPTIESEKSKIDIFSTYNAALQNAHIADAILEKQPKAPSIYKPQPTENNLTAVHRVLTLPEILDIIFSHLSTVSKTNRNTLHAAALTSVSMHHAAQKRLWRRPRNLATVERQVRFAFGVVISSTLGEGLGTQVQCLRIWVTRGAWNRRLITKIVESCPSIICLTLYWGYTSIYTVAVEDVHVSWLTKLLALLPNLTSLGLVEAPSTTIAPGVNIPAGVCLPFTKLEGLWLHGFGWYFTAIEGSLGPNLTSLDIDLSQWDPEVTRAQLSTVVRRLTSLTVLRIVGNLELDLLRLFVGASPGLEKIVLTPSGGRDEVYMASLYAIIADLPAIEDIAVSVRARPVQIIQLAKSSAPLRTLRFEVYKDEAESSLRAALVEFITAKRTTLRGIYDRSGFKLAADDQLVEALAAAPELDYVDLSFDPERITVSDAVVIKLLTSCPYLGPTEGLATLAAGNPLYEQSYRAAFKRTEEELYEELAEDAWFI